MVKSRSAIPIPPYEICPQRPPGQPLIDALKTAGNLFKREIDDPVSDCLCIFCSFSSGLLAQNYLDPPIKPWNCSGSPKFVSHLSLAFSSTTAPRATLDDQYTRSGAQLGGTLSTEHTTSDIESEIKRAHPTSKVRSAKIQPFVHRSTNQHTPAMTCEQDGTAQVEETTDNANEML